MCMIYLLIYRAWELVMPSKWNDFNIDWNDIGKYRQDIVLYQLAQATRETYVYAYRETVGIFQQNYNIPLNYLNENYHKRQEELFVDICSLLRRMFSIDESYFIDDNYPTATKCFISDNESPSIQANWSQSNGIYSIYNSYLMGINVLDISQGGELELNCGDLSFLRDDFYYGRITTNMLSSIYKILTYPMKCIFTPFFKNVSGFTGYLGINNSRFSKYIIGLSPNRGFGGGRGRDYFANTGYTPDINTAVTRMYTNEDGHRNNDLLYSNMNRIRLRNNQTSASGVWEAVADNTRYESGINGNTYIQYKNGSIDINDFKMDIIKWSVKDDLRPNRSYFGLYEDGNPYTTTTERVNNIEFNERVVNETIDGFWNTGDDVVTSGIPTYPVTRDFARQEDIYQTFIGLGKINAKGIMDYYTEEAN